jgi:hypothetical protein
MQRVRYLDAAVVPARYKVRRVEGEPVPMNVLAEMQRHPAEPWKVRDRILNDMNWCSKGIPWAKWKAAELNRLFHEEGVTTKTGRITAETVGAAKGHMSKRQEKVKKTALQPNLILSGHKRGRTENMSLSYGPCAPANPCRSTVVCS